VADGIRAVIRDDVEEFVIDYPCHLCASRPIAGRRRSSRQFRRQPH
jgi:hypothetical protein